MNVVQVEEPKFDVLGVVLDSISLHSDIWNKYFDDYIYCKFSLESHGEVKCGFFPQRNIAHRILYVYFEELHRQSASLKLTELHCYLSIYQLSMTEMTALLRPLSKIEEVRVEGCTCMR